MTKKERRFIERVKTGLIVFFILFSLFLAFCLMNCQGEVATYKMFYGPNWDNKYQEPPPNTAISVTKEGHFFSLPKKPER